MILQVASASEDIFHWRVSIEYGATGGAAASVDLYIYSPHGSLVLNVTTSFETDAPSSGVPLHRSAVRARTTSDDQWDLVFKCSHQT